jgi:hypothetical protein
MDQCPIWVGLLLTLVFFVLSVCGPADGGLFCGPDFDLLVSKRL